MKRSLKNGMESPSSSSSRLHPSSVNQEYFTIIGDYSKTLIISVVHGISVVLSLLEYERKFVLQGLLRLFDANFRWHSSFS
jgi:hypothetical protein